MSTTPQPPPEPQPEPPPEPQPKKPHNAWKWATAGVVVVAVGLLIWGVKSQSDLDDAQAEVAQLEAATAKAKDTGSDVAGELKAANDELSTELGATNEDLAATQKDLEQAQQDAADAQQQAADAQKQADSAKDQTDKAKAQADQARAQADEADAKLKVAADCAQSYFTAFGQLLETDDPQAQADALKEQLAGITESCKAALGGS